MCNKRMMAARTVDGFVELGTIIERAFELGPPGCFQKKRGEQKDWHSPEPGKPILLTVEGDEGCEHTLRFKTKNGVQEVKLHPGDKFAFFDYAPGCHCSETTGPNGVILRPAQFLEPVDPDQEQWKPGLTQE